MSYVLFHIKTGEFIKSYATEAAARTGMRTSNRNSGWTERLSRSWTNGYEMEWCRAPKGTYIAPQHTYGHGPYGITDYDRWAKNINPNSQHNQYLKAYND